MHEGKITAFSDGLGQGSEVFVQLPVLTGELDLYDKPEPPSEPMSMSAHSRILVVDDNDDNAGSRE